MYKCTNTRQLRSINHVYKCTNTRHVCNFNDVITPHPTHPPQPHVLPSIQHVCNFIDAITPHPTHSPQPHVLVASNICATSTMSLHPTPPTHPNPTCYVASNMCATWTMSLHPTPPTHPNPTCYVASYMCATSTMSLHPTPPTHPNHTCYVASNMCATSLMSLHPTPPTHPTQPTWQAWRKMHLSHRLQWAKHVPKRVVTYDWSQKQSQPTDYQTIGDCFSMHLSQDPCFRSFTFLWVTRLSKAIDQSSCSPANFKKVSCRHNLEGTYALLLAVFWVHKIPLIHRWIIGLNLSHSIPLQWGPQDTFGIWKSW